MQTIKMKCKEQEVTPALRNITQFSWFYPKMKLIFGSSYGSQNNLALTTSSPPGSAATAAAQFVGFEPDSFAG